MGGLRAATPQSKARRRSAGDALQLPSLYGRGRGAKGSSLHALVTKTPGAMRLLGADWREPRVWASRGMQGMLR